MSSRKFTSQSSVKDVVTNLVNSEAVHSQCACIEDYRRREVRGTKGERCDPSKL